MSRPLLLHATIPPPPPPPPPSLNVFEIKNSLLAAVLHCGYSTTLGSKYILVSSFCVALLDNARNGA